MSVDETSLTVAYAVCNVCRNERNGLCLLHNTTVKLFSQATSFRGKIFA